MYEINQRILGILILVLLGVLVVIKQIATGSILDKPKGKFLVQLVNIFNLFFLLVAGRLETVDPTLLAVENQTLFVSFMVLGLLLYLIGHFLMAWALMRLRNNYQLGGSIPRATDQFVILGPYRLVRHPMYAAALYISLGLALLTQSLACLAVFFIYLVLISLLIPVEEKGLRQVYGDKYTNYQHHVRKLIPFVY